MGMPAKSTWPNENRYPAQIVRAPIAIAMAKVATRSFTAFPERLCPVAQYHTSVTTTADGKNARVESLERTASPVERPNHAAFAAVGRSTQTRPLRNEAPRKAVSAISVVASPACAKTAGTDRKSTRLNSSHLVISYA